MSYFKYCLPFLFALLGGGIMPYAFAPYYFGISSIASCVLFLISIANLSPRKAFLVGGCYGLAFFGLGVSWVYVSIHEFGAASPLLAGGITALFIAILALFPASLAALLNTYFSQNNVGRTLFAFPALWVLFEIVRGSLFTGFPWLFVGYAQMNNQLNALAPLGGVWAVSWAAVFVAGAIYAIIDYFYQNKENTFLRNSLFASILMIWGIAFGLGKLNWTHATNKQLNIALVQGNVAQLMRWDPAHVQRIINTYETLTQNVFNNQPLPDLIIWPEGAIPVPLPTSEPVFQAMDTFMKTQGSALIAGVPTHLPDDYYYNSLIGVGFANGIYHKEHLVPFGEYVPFEKSLRGLIAFFNLPMSSFISGPSQQGPLIAAGYRFAPAICYEIAYPLFVRKISKNADFILTVSNDTWFGKSIGPHQHLQIAQFRALETGKPVIRATNTGFTALINADGSIQGMAPAFETTVLLGALPVIQGETPWTKWGVWPLFVVLGVSLGIAIAIRFYSKEH